MNYSQKQKEKRKTKIYDFKKSSLNYVLGIGLVAFVCHWKIIGFYCY